MSSSLLDQAVIDASSLKEAAMKNAESIILEKYASELKNAVDTILEQNETDLLGDLGGGDMPPTEDPMAKNIPMAATDGEKLCPCPDDDQEIEINFDQLAQHMSGNEEEPGMPGQQGELKPEEDESMMEEAQEGVQVPAQLGPELQMYHRSMGDNIYKVSSLAITGKPVPTEMLQKAIDELQPMVGKMGDPDENQEVEKLVGQLQDVLSSHQQQDEKMLGAGGTDTMGTMSDGDYNQNLYEDIDITEELIGNILETLDVKMEPVPHGHAGRATSAERTYAGEVELARTQDDSRAEEIKALKKAFEKIQESKQHLEEEVTSLKIENNKIKGIALQASKKLSDINLENAKLLYMNRALKSSSLNERQKETIVENISKVGSVNEAKIVFETLKKNTSAKGPKVPETLTEALALNKGNTLAFKPTKTTESINPQKERMQRLAGIKKQQ